MNLLGNVLPLLLTESCLKERTYLTGKEEEEVIGGYSFSLRLSPIGKLVVGTALPNSMIRIVSPPTEEDVSWLVTSAATAEELDHLATIRVNPASFFVMAGYATKKRLKIKIAPQMEIDYYRPVVELAFNPREPYKEDALVFDNLVRRLADNLEDGAEKKDIREILRKTLPRMILFSFPTQKNEIHSLTQTLHLLAKIPQSKYGDLAELFTHVYTYLGKNKVGFPSRLLFLPMFSLYITLSMALSQSLNKGLIREAICSPLMHFGAFIMCYLEFKKPIKQDVHKRVQADKVAFFSVLGGKPFHPIFHPIGLDSTIKFDMDDVGEEDKELARLWNKTYEAMPRFACIYDKGMDYAEKIDDLMTATVKPPLQMLSEMERREMIDIGSDTPGDSIGDDLWYLAKFQRDRVIESEFEKAINTCKGYCSWMIRQHTKDTLGEYI